MKQLILLATFAVLSLSVFATGTPPATGAHIPRIYLVMNKGKLVEVNHGKRRVIKKDVTLTNETTIHPNGAIDASSGQSLQLKEGQYMTMDGKIRLLKDMGRRNS